jgi:hypothetical protein
MGQPGGHFPWDRTKLLFLSAVAIAVFGVRANSPDWASGNQGHEIVSTIAVDNLSPAAREHVAKILGTLPDVESSEKAMAAASMRPDTEFREEDRSTAPWHFIDICFAGPQERFAGAMPWRSLRYSEN